KRTPGAVDGVRPHPGAVRGPNDRRVHAPGSDRAADHGSGYDARDADIGSFVITSITCLARTLAMLTHSVSCFLFICFLLRMRVPPVLLFDAGVDQCGPFRPVSGGVHAPTAATARGDEEAIAIVEE